jgi:lambda family phage portal protein
VSQKPHNIQSAFADIRADYDATRYSRFVRRRTGVAAMGSGPDYHIRTESKYYELIEQARDMDRNDGLVGILADRRVDNIVQSGFTLDPRTGDKGLDSALWQWWEDFSNDPDQCDITGEFTWKEIERQCCRSESIDGDIVVTGTEEGSFQLLESHLIRTKAKVDDTFLGVTTDRVGRRVQYHVADELSEFGQFGDVTPIDVRNAEGIRQVFHVFDPKRVNLTRGITQLAPVFSLSGMLEDINFAKLVQQQVVSCFAVFRKMAAGGNRLPSADGYGDTKTETTPVGTRQLEGVSPGMEVIGQPGEELQGFSPNVPNSEYFQQVKLILQIIGVNFGLPLCLVLMDGSETNFSGWRGAVDEARKGFVADQMNLVRRLNKGAYKWRLWWDLQQPRSEFREAFSKLGDVIFRHNWNLPTWSYIEPVADAQGDAEQLKNGLTSPRRLHAARGKDWEEIAEECIEDNAYAITRAQQMAAKINQQFPESPPINWRDLVALPMPEGMTMSMQDPAAVAVQEDAANAEQGAPKKPQARAKKKARAQSESMNESMLQAEILLHIYGDDAEEVLFGSGPQAAFDEGKVKRDEKGRFTSKGSAGALKAAKESLSKALQGERTRQSARQLSDHLENLTVKQLTELKKEYGIKASGPTKKALIEKLADRLDRGRRQAKPEKKEKEKKTLSNTASMTRQDFIAAISSKKTEAEQNVAIIDWITATGVQKRGKAHGMSDSVVMREVVVGGVKWKTEEGAEAAAADTMRQIHLAHMPQRVTSAVNVVVHTKQANEADAYWAKTYGITGFQSAATGGDGAMVVYNGKSADPSTFAHEAGHTIANEIWGTTDPPKASEYGKAQQIEKPVSAYGKAAPGEDFAEAVDLYTTNPQSMQRDFPRKYAALKNIMEQSTG